MDPQLSKIFLSNQIGQFSSALLDQVRSALYAVAIFILGLFVSEFIKYLSTSLLKALRWDAFCARIGCARILERLWPGTSPSAAVGLSLFWFTWVTFLMKALEKLDLAWLSAAGRMYFTYLPAVLTAAGQALVYGLAAWAAGKVLRALVAQPAALLMAGLLQALVLNLGLYAVLLTLGVDRLLAQPAALILLAGSVLALALAWALRREDRLRPVIRVPDGEEV